MTCNVETFQRACVMIGLAAVALTGIQPVQARDIGGNYTVNGTNFDGSPYGGTATVVMTSKNTCRITWETGTTSHGICMRHGPAFSASYTFEGGKMGLVIYEIKADGSLDGIWTIADTEGAGTEVLSPQ